MENEIAEKSSANCQNFFETDIQVARVAGQFKGIYTTHMRNEGDQQMAAIEETLRIAHEAGIAAHISQR